MGPRTVQKKRTTLQVTPVPQQKKARIQKLISELKSLYRHEKYYMDQLRKTAKLTLIRDWTSFSQRKDLYDAELIAELMMRRFPGRPDYAKKIEVAVEQMTKRANTLRKKMRALGINNFINEKSYYKVYKGLIPNWRASLFIGKAKYKLYRKKQQEQWKEFMSSFKPKRYATMSAQRGRGIPYWQRPAPKVLKTGHDWLRYSGGGSYLYIGEGGKPVPRSVLRVQRELEKRRLQGLSKPMSSTEFFKTIIPIISSLDAAVSEIQIMWDKGISWKGSGKVVLYLALAATEVVFVGQIATKTAARATGKQVATSIAKAEGKLTLTQAETRVFETALRELKPREIKDLLRLARPSKGFGRHRVMEELAKRAGKGEITGDVMRTYLRDTVGKSRIRRTLFRAKHGIKDFYSNLGFFSKQNFRERVEAEFFNELRLSLDFKACKAAAESLKAAKLSSIQNNIASDALFFTSTSFSRGTQKAFAKLVKEKGWPKIIRMLKQEADLAKKLPKKIAGQIAQSQKRIRALQKELLKGRGNKHKLARMLKEERFALDSLMVKQAKIKKVTDLHGLGIRNGLEKLLPKYSRSFLYAPIHRLVEYGVFLAIAPYAFDAIVSMITGLKQKARRAPEKPIQTIRDARNAFRSGTKQYLGEKY
jgi:hypothetical protein